MNRLLRTGTCAAGLVAFLGGEPACGTPRPQQNARLTVATGGGSAAHVGGALSLAGGAAGQGGEGGSLASGGEGPLAGSGGSSPTQECQRSPFEALSFSKQNLLRSVAACVWLRHCEFRGAAERLSAASITLQATETDEARREARSAYEAAMTRWARVEAMRFGPAASSQDDMVHGQGLRDLIYSWPNVSRCRVEEQLFGQAYREVGMESLVQVSINSRGLFALEYLLFFEGMANDCSAFSVTNASDAWNLTPPLELRALKRSYLGAVAQDVRDSARTLEESWKPTGGDYARRLTEGEGYMGLQGALNSVAQALMYVEVEVKDYKVGALAGVYQNAPLERPEHSFARGSTVLMRENLLGFRDVFLGCEGKGLGYDDWLEATGHGDLAGDLLKGLSAVLQRLETFPDLPEASVRELLDLYAALKLLTDPLKTEFFGSGSPLGLTLPRGVEGDTD